MNQKGFTMMELLVAVVIIGVLTSMALPQYMRSLERARATEAMTALKAFNDAVYTYSAGRTGSVDNVCPQGFQKLSVTLAHTSATIESGNETKIMTRDFTYSINDATGVLIPGTPCPGVTAKRTGAESKYDYIIWNPYVKGTAGKGASLACYSPGDIASSKAVCESLDLYTEGATPYAS